MSWVYDIDHEFGLPADALLALVGGKAAGLRAMAVDLGLPVPPAFVVTTEACRAYLAGGWPDGLDAELRDHMATLGARVGRRFGDPADPLLVSVRSGAPVSMPGMMDTILNLGLTPATAAGLAARSGDGAFAAACRARFEAQYRGIVGAPAVPDDPWAQLRDAVEAVFRSWNGDRARAYRAKEGIPDDLGTAVTVQAMVFGNRDAASATGVLFTRNPATGERTLYGDVMFGAQGEDVVAGTHATEPIAVLDARLPSVAAELRAHAERLERHTRDVCDIEFTIESGRLWLLQCRAGKRSPQAALRIAVEMAEDPDFPLSREEAVRRVAGLLADPPRVAAAVVGGDSAAGDASDPAGGVAPLARGLGASPGIASGEIVTSPEAAVAAADAGRRVILVRTETAPDDVHGMARAAGILTATGGLASHAAVVARGWGIPAVVGASAVRIEGDVVRIGETVLRAGDPITIDGTTGAVLPGLATDAGDERVAPEAAVLLGWAAEMGIPVGDAEGGDASAGGRPDQATAAEAAATDASIGARSADDVVRLLAIKGYALPEAAAEALSIPADEAGALLDRLVADGLAELAAGAYRLTADGRAVAAERLALDRERWGPAAADAALDAFLALDHRMKETVTAWQMREVDGVAAFNDHTDAVYDGAVLARLAALHADAAAFLAPLEAGLPRLADYRRRLERAAAAVAAGDHRFVASPRVDSYHGVWFELHEDLIRLAGRTREAEAAAGRA